MGKLTIDGKDITLKIPVIIVTSWEPGNSHGGTVTKNNIVYNPGYKVYLRMGQRNVEPLPIEKTLTLIPGTSINYDWYIEASSDSSEIPELRNNYNYGNIRITWNTGNTTFNIYITHHNTYGRIPNGENLGEIQGTQRDNDARVEISL